MFNQNNCVGFNSLLWLKVSRSKKLLYTTSCLISQTTQQPDIHTLFLIKVRHTDFHRSLNLFEMLLSPKKSLVLYVQQNIHFFSIKCPMPEIWGSWIISSFFCPFLRRNSILIVSFLGIAACFLNSCLTVVMNPGFSFAATKHLRYKVKTCKQYC